MPGTGAVRDKAAGSYSLLLPAFLALAQRALAAAESAALPSALNLRLEVRAGLGEPLAARRAAQRARAAAPMRARPAALMFRFRFLGCSGLAAGAAADTPSMSVSFFCRASIRSLRSAALRNCFGERSTVLMRAMWTKPWIRSSEGWGALL